MGEEVWQKGAPTNIIHRDLHNAGLPLMQLPHNNAGRVSNDRLGLNGTEATNREVGTANVEVHESPSVGRKGGESHSTELLPIQLCQNNANMDNNNRKEFWDSRQLPTSSKHQDNKERKRKLLSMLPETTSDGTQLAKVRSPTMQDFHWCSYIMTAQALIPMAERDCGYAGRPAVWEKWAFHYSNEHFSMRSFLSIRFFILNSKFLGLGFWCPPKTILNFHIHKISEMTTSRGTLITKLFCELSAGKG